MSPLAQFDVYVINSSQTVPSSFGMLTNMVLTLCMVFSFTLIIMWFSSWEVKLIATDVQKKFELGVIYIVTLVFHQIKKKGIVFFPFFLGLFLSILVMNLISLFPYSFAVTSHFTWSMSLSLSISLGIFFLGLLKNGIAYLKIFILQIPLLLYPLMTAIELSSYVIRAFSLSIRLSANIMAGHILVELIGEIIAFLNYHLIDGSMVSSSLMGGLFFLEVGVACLQAYVFNLLVSLYVNDAVNPSAH